MSVFHFQCTNAFLEEGNVRLTHKPKNKSKRLKGYKKYTEVRSGKYEIG